ncbi:FAD binding domain-containing protein, partial [Metarhizium hybridum]
MAQGGAKSISAAPSASVSDCRPVIIIGAGISGLLLAQHLRQQGVPFRIFERDADMNTRGVGWGLTLNWSLPMLRSLLRPELLSRFAETYVDRQGIASGLVPRFPFYDLSTGELKATTPPLPETVRVRVTRERLRKWLATDVDIEWGKAFKSFVETPNSCSDEAVNETGEGCSSVITVTFDDGSTCVGGLLVACDGSNSRVRKVLFPELAQENLYRIPIAVMGVKMQLSTVQIAGMREQDAYFLQGTSSENDSFVYMSVLDAPGNSPDNPPDSYNLQICLSWPYRDGYLGREKQVRVPDTQEDRRKLFLEFAASYAEPFRSVMGAITNDTEIRSVDLSDWPPPKGLHTTGNAVLMGDSLHHMAMYRGEGANHAIADVVDFANHVTPLLVADNESASTAGNERQTATSATADNLAAEEQAANGLEQGILRHALDQYEDVVINRARPGVLASRRACLDAHEWARIGPESPLLTKRQMDIVYDEVADRIVG